MSLRDRDRCGQSQVSGIHGLLVTQRERSPNRQIVKSTDRDTRSGKRRGIIIRACSSKRYVNPDLVLPYKLYKSAPRTRTDVQQHVRVHTYMHSRIHASLHTSTNRCTSTRARVYTLKGGYIGFPVTTNLPRHRAIYISVESIAPTKNQ